MAFEKYSPQTARGIAARIALHYSDELAAVAQAYPSVSVAWLVGLTGMENPNCREWPGAGSVRFEAGVFAHLASFAAGKPGSYNGMSAALLRGVGLDVIRALSTSYGQTQIMGYEMLELFSGPDDANKSTNVILGQILKGDAASTPEEVVRLARSIGMDGPDSLARSPQLSDLRNPSLHYFFTAWWFTHDPVLARLLRLWNEAKAKGQVPGWFVFEQLCHYWNCGRLWDGNPSHIHTYSPYYMANCEAVAQAFLAIPATRQAGLLPAQTPSSAVTAQDETQTTEATMSNRPTAFTDASAQNPDVSDPQVNPPDSIPTIGVKPGWQTSEAHIVAALGLIATALSGFGFHVLPEHLTNTADALGHLFAVIGPFTAFIPLAWHYVTSRGKLKSNAVNATALASLGDTAFAQQGLLGSNSVVNSIFGGQNWKDPSRYVNIAKTVGGVAGGPVGGIIGQILGGDAQTTSAARTEFTDAVLEQIFTALQNRLASVEVEVTNKPASGPASSTPASSTPAS